MKAMLSSKQKIILTTVLLLGATGLGTAPRTALAQSKTDAASEKPTATLGPAEFKELKAKLDIKNQPWATIPWKYTITEARKAAAAAKKPIFMVVNSGNCLGCT
jgi:hypothetical protein